MISILEKYEHNADFHQIVDFVVASHLRVETSDEETKIFATVDGKPITISESSIRRNLKMRDEAGISSLPNAELFKNLTLMGYNISLNQKFTFQKGQFSHQWKYLIHTIMQCLSLKSTCFNEFSSNIATALVCLATNRVYNFSKMIFDGMVRNVNNKVSKFLMYPRVNSPSFLGRTVPLFPSMLVTMGEGSGTPTEPHHTPTPEATSSPQHELPSSSLPLVSTATIPTVIPTETPPLRQYTRRARIAQSSALPTVADEHASPFEDDNQGEACPTQDEMVSKITAQDLEISQLKAMIKILKDRDGEGDDPSEEYAIIKGRSLETGEEVEVLTVSIPPAGEVLTSSSVVSTASPIFTTATVTTPYSRRKGKEKMVESETPKKKKLQEQMDVQMARQLEEEMAKDAQRMNEQIVRDAEIARIHAEEELQMPIDGLDRNNETTQQRKPLSKKQQKEFYMSVLRSHAGWKTKHFKGMSLEEIRERFVIVWKQIEDFIPIGSKEEGERFKIKGLRLEQDSAKKVKTSEDVSEEDLKTMMQLVPVEEVYVEALHVKHQIIDWKIHTERERSYWKIIRLGGSSASYQFFVDMLKHFDREDLNKLWALVKETLSIMPATSDKEKELWVEVKRLYEPDVEDQLWTHTQALIHDPVEWRLYDSCGVHHVLSGDQEIFMLVERDYPLRKGIAIVMISNKLQVENYSQMANDLILKIHQIANSPRQRVSEDRVLVRVIGSGAKDVKVEKKMLHI
uniref:Synaptobrevin, longin-like domain protein n=1 Tax=Tanacetum cinerariifolium TaxID=118510 RepID=A0A6L2N562_TANCI|nr:hypothetical protein [Tanacetum cinerariifolium]